jgi:excisionase family DNA binding protein
MVYGLATAGNGNAEVVFSPDRSRGQAGDIVYGNLCPVGPEHAAPSPREVSAQQSAPDKAEQGAYSQQEGFDRLPEIMDVEKAAQYLGKSGKTIRRWATGGTMPCAKTPGGQWIFRLARLRGWVDDGCPKPRG